MYLIGYQFSYTTPLHSYLPLDLWASLTSVGKESACNARDLGLIPGSGRSPGEENVNPLQYSCLENPMDRGAWQTTVHGVSKTQTRLSDQAQHSTAAVVYNYALPT